MLGVQCTTAADGSARWRKLAANPALVDWLRAGNRGQLWAWGKRGPRGGRKTWQLARGPLTLADLDGVRPETPNGGDE